jgi:hypothetical protein
MLLVVDGEVTRVLLPVVTTSLASQNTLQAQQAAMPASELMGCDVHDSGVESSAAKGKETE